MSATAAPMPVGMPSQAVGKTAIENSALVPSQAAPNSVALAEEIVRAEGDAEQIAMEAGAFDVDDAAALAQRADEAQLQACRDAQMDVAERLLMRAEVPPALRDRLSAVIVESIDALNAPAGEEPHLPLAACLRAIEESLPEFLRQNRGDAARPEHPLGKVFFAGKPEDVSDARAEALAREQLERCGLLRGQRARVAD